MWIHLEKMEILVRMETRTQNLLGKNYSKKLEMKT